MNEKRRLLIDTAFRLFYENGINGVGINEILAVSGIAKKTLYSHFASKDELVIATLQERDTVFLTWLDGELKNSNTSSEVIEQLFAALTKWFTNQVPELTDFRGCYFIKTSGQCADRQSPVFTYCMEHKQKVRALLANYLQIEDELLLDQLCLMKEGAIVTAYLNHDLHAAEKCIPAALKLLTPNA